MLALYFFKKNYRLLKEAFFAQMLSIILQAYINGLLRIMDALFFRQILVKVTSFKVKKKKLHYHYNQLTIFIFTRFLSVTFVQFFLFTIFLNFGQMLINFTRDFLITHRLH